jgi:acyl-CoA synthetase (AMP-forming)/AMP-acid ligase II
MRIEDLLIAQARHRPGAVVCKTGTHTVTYGNLEQRSNQLSAGLFAEGLSEGDRVVVALHNGPELLEAMFATARSNLVMVPVNPASSVFELRQILSDSNARALILHASKISAADLAAPSADTLLVVEVDGEADNGNPRSYESLLKGSEQSANCVSQAPSGLDPWLLAYTSGSTGRPKGVVLSHRAKFLSAVTEALESRLKVDDVGLINTPMFHVHGLVFAAMIIAGGGTIVFARNSTAKEVLDTIVAEKVTQISMVPTIYQAFIDAAQTGDELSFVRIARCTGAPLTATLRNNILSSFPGLPLHVLYGGTEVGAVSTLVTAELTRKDGSVGQPMIGVELQVRDSEGRPLPVGSKGEIYVRSDYICTGYFQNQEMPDGEYRRWISLGDVGEIDNEGYLFLKGRSTEIIISGGENISEQEVEAALERHPAIAAAAVVGLSDPYWGEIVKAFVELREGQQVDPDKIIESTAEYLARYKLPKVIEVTQSLPRNAFGKIDKRSLRSAGQPDHNQIFED